MKYFTFFLQSMKSVCILYLQSFSIQISHISHAEWPHLATDYLTWQCIFVPLKDKRLIFLVMFINISDWIIDRWFILPLYIAHKEWRLTWGQKGITHYSVVSRESAQEGNIFLIFSKKGWGKIYQMFRLPAVWGFVGAI